MGQDKVTEVSMYKGHDGPPRRLTLPKTINIPAGVILTEAPTCVERSGYHYELIIGIGNDQYGTLVLSEGAMRALTTLKSEVSIS